MNKPKILALVPFLVQDALAISVLRVLRERGFDVTVVHCEDASHVYKPDRMEDFIADGAMIDLIDVPQARRLETLKQAVDERGIDLVLQYGAYELYHVLPYLKEQRPNVRIVDTLYNEFGHTVNHFLYENCFDGVIVESEHMRRFIERSSLKADPRVVVVTSGVNLDEFRPLASRETGRPLTIGYVGRMSNEKNPLGFVAMAEVLAKRLPHVSFDMYGGGGMAELVRERVAESEARAQLKYRGFAQHQRDALHAIDVLVLPSKFDGRPNIIMEANACGVPVIGAPVGGVPEMIEAGRNGYLAHPTEIQRIADWLVDWSVHPESLQRLQRSSREMALERFDRDGMLDAYADTFCRFTAR